MTWPAAYNRGPVRLEIQTTNLELTPSLRTYIEKKIGGLDRFIKRLPEDVILAEVEVGRSTRHHRHGQVYHAEVNLTLPGKLIRAAHDDEDLRRAIDEVKEKLKREIEKYKGKR